MQSPLGFVGGASREQASSPSAGANFYRAAAKVAMTRCKGEATLGSTEFTRQAGIAGDGHHRADTDCQNNEGGERALLEAAAGRELVDVGGERFDIQRP